MLQVLTGPANDGELSNGSNEKSVLEKVKAQTAQFPIYNWLSPDR